MCLIGPKYSTAHPRFKNFREKCFGIRGDDHMGNNNEMK